MSKGRKWMPQRERGPLVTIGPDGYPVTEAAATAAKGTSRTKREERERVERQPRKRKPRT